MEKVSDTEWRPLAEADDGDIDGDGNKTERVTYSETVAYVLLRAVMIDDRETFAKVWNWAQHNLQRAHLQELWTCPENQASACGGDWRSGAFAAARPDSVDRLFAWRYVPSLNGKDANGKDTMGGVIDFNRPDQPDISGYYAASDDIEIAAALYFAQLKGWGQGSSYLNESQAILADAWKKYVVDVQHFDPATSQAVDQYYFFAGDTFADSSEINPSYFRPAYFSRVFPLIEQSLPLVQRHPWAAVADTSYEVIEQNGQLKLGSLAGKANLPSNWLDMDQYGRFEESDIFSGPAGEVFGRDAIRTLWAVAQDAAMFNSQAASRYLTDPAVGPSAFLAAHLDPRNFRPTAFNHDGTLISNPGRDIPQLRGLSTEQIFMYGPYLAYFNYGNDQAMTDKIYQRLAATYNEAGYWGNDDQEYFTQNWIWLGLALVSSLNGDLARLVPPPPPAPPAAQSATNLNISAQHNYSLRARLDRDLTEGKVTIAQLKSVLEAVAGAPCDPLDMDKTPSPAAYPQFPQIGLAEKTAQIKLLPYLSDLREYWNNAIILLSVYAQKTGENSDQAGMERAVYYCQQLRLRIEKQLASGPELAPHAYSRVVLDLTEAELRAKVEKKDLGFYREGINAAARAINQMRAVDPTEAQPDYYLVTKALIAIGDLYLQMDTATRQMCLLEPLPFLDEASKYYGYVAALQSANGSVTVDAWDDDLWFTMSNGAATASLEYNFQKGYLTENQKAEAQKSLTYLEGIALAKNAAIYLRRPGAKDIVTLLQTINNCGLAIDQLNRSARKPNDFFINFARLTKADLLLALADRVKYNLWESDPSYAGQLIARIELLLSRPADDLMFAAVKELIDNPQSSGAIQLDEAAKKKIIFQLYGQLMGQARDLYQATPHDFQYLYADSTVKLTEVAIRQVTFLTHEARLLRPFYLDPAFTSQNHFQPGDFVTIELNYLKALLLISTKRRENVAPATELLDQVIAGVEELDEPFRTYFTIYAQLKKAELMCRFGNAKQQAAGLKLFATAAQTAEALSPAYRQQMSWRPDAFLAELYHEWANTIMKSGSLEASQQFARQALEHAMLSDNEYDYKVRSKKIVDDFLL